MKKGLNKIYYLVFVLFKFLESFCLKKYFCAILKIVKLVFGMKKYHLYNLFIVVCYLLIIGFLILWNPIPKIELNGDSEITILLNESYQELGAKVKTLSQKQSQLKIEGNVDTTKVGDYFISYSLEYKGKRIQEKRIIKVREKEKPAIILSGDMRIKLCPNHEYEEQGYEAYDNYDGNLTDKVIIHQLKDKWIYTVEDSSHNPTAIAREFIYEDEEKPSIILQGSSVVTVYQNETYQEPGYQAYDNCDGNLTDQVKVSGTVNTSVTGTYELKYTVYDTAGHIAEETRVVRVTPAPDMNGKVIYLTFDDGPSRTITPGVLQILKEENVKATFFIINHDDSLNYLIKQAYDDGHTIAIHSYTHNYRQIYASEVAFFEDLNLMSNKLESIIGVKPYITRFPGGSSNTVSKFNPGIMTTLAKELTNKGYIYFDWNIESGDAGNVSSAYEVYQNVISSLGSHTNVVLMHDYESNYYTLNALRDIIHYGKNNGYTFSNITDTTPQIKHKIAN